MLEARCRKMSGFFHAQCRRLCHSSHEPIRHPIQPGRHTRCTLFTGRKKMAMYWLMCTWCPMPPNTAGGLAWRARRFGATSAAARAACGWQGQPGADQMAGGLPGGSAKFNCAGARGNLKAQAVAAGRQGGEPCRMGQVDHARAQPEKAPSRQTNAINLIAICTHKHWARP